MTCTHGQLVGVCPVCPTPTDHIKDAIACLELAIDQLAKKQPKRKRKVKHAR